MDFYFVMMLNTSLQNDFGDVGNIYVLVQGLVCTPKDENGYSFWTIV
jgi:hypothetical protein